MFLMKSQQMSFAQFLCSCKSQIPHSMIKSKYIQFYTLAILDNLFIKKIIYIIKLLVKKIKK